MNKIIFMLCGLMLFSSCSQTIYYQVCKVGSTLPKTALGNYVYEDDLCVISYNFWSRGGNPGFVFTNNTDDIIYIDLSKSFFIKNGIAYDYYLNRTKSSSISLGSSSSATSSATSTVSSNKSSGSSTIYEFGMADLTSTSKGVSVGASEEYGKQISFGKSTTYEMEEKPIVAIPPHSSKLFSEYSIISKYFYYCEYNIIPKNREKPTYNFDLSNSPVRFRNYITYKIGNDDKEYSVTNDFYINSTTYYHENTITEKINKGCPKEQKRIEVINCASPDKFYIPYTVEYQTYSHY